MKDLETLVAYIGAIDSRTKVTANRSVDRLLTFRNWLIGACIVEYEQDGEDRAAYGARLVSELAQRLRERKIRGLGARNLRNCRQLALAWPGLDIWQTVSAISGRASEEVSSIWQTPSAKSSLPSSEEPHQQAKTDEIEEDRTDVLSALGNGELKFPSLAARAATMHRLEWQDQAWEKRLFSSLSFSQLLELSRIDDPLKRAFYELECLRSGWSVDELRRQIGSMLYERVGLSKDKDAVLAMAQHGALIDTPGTIIRDPYVLEFLGLEKRTRWSESDLERELIDHLQQFVHELGSDYCFVDRQYRLTVGGRHHFIDLLFFHRRLKSLIAMDLKLDSFRHEDAGQMNFYLSYLAENVALPDENPPVGLVLCADKDAAEVHYATAGLERSIFVSRYLVQLPSENDLRRWLEEERSVVEERLRAGRNDAAR